MNNRIPESFPDNIVKSKQYGKKSCPQTMDDCITKEILFNI